MNIFEQASRVKLRFASSKGQLAVEDLWALPLTSERGISLDNIAVALAQEAKEAGDSPVSFVNPAASTPANAETLLKLEIAKHIIGVRVAENNAKADRENRRAQKEKLRDVLERRQNAELDTKTPAEIQAMIDAL